LRNSKDPTTYSSNLLSNCASDMPHRLYGTPFELERLQKNTRSSLKPYEVINKQQFDKQKKQNSRSMPLDPNGL